MIGTIFRFEVLNRFKQPLFYIFFALMMFQAVWFLQGSYDVYINDATHMNGAASFYRSLSGGGIILTIVIALVSASALYRDIRYKTGSIVYTAAGNEKRFFIQKFLSAYVINLILGLGICAGLVLSPFMGLASPDKFGPTPWGQMVHGYLIFMATNLFVYTAFSIASLVVFKRISASYLSVFFITLLFFICETVRPLSSNVGPIQILDPSCFVYTTLAMDALPADAKNYSFISLNGFFWINRLLWMGLSTLYLTIAYKQFSFKRFIQKTVSSKKKNQKKTISPESPVGQKAMPKNSPEISVKFKYLLQKVFRLSLLEFKNVVRTRGFKVLILVLSIAFFLMNLLWNASFFTGPSHPLTSIMTNTRITVGTWLTIVLMIWTTELLFKDRVHKFWQVKDALPIPAWTVVLPRAIAMGMVAFILAGMFVVFGIVVQLGKGAFQEIDMVLYLTDTLGYKWGWLNYLQMIAIVVLFAGLTANRFATHILSIWFFFFNMVNFDMEIIEELRFIYMFVPGVDDYSEMNGYGIWETSIFWFWLLWAIMSLIFVALGIYFWKRGAQFKWKEKITLRGNQLNWIGRGTVLVLVAAFVGLQSFIIANVNDLGNFESKKEGREKAAAYEKKYKKIAAQSQPKIMGLDLNMDFYPNVREVKFTAKMTLTNRTDASINILYLNVPDFTTFSKIKINQRKLEPIWYDEELDVMALALDMPQHTSAELEIQGSRVHQGFTQDKFTQQPEVTYNGSFLGVHDFLPVFGYNEDKELTENRYRGDWKLDKLETRMAPVENQIALKQSVFAVDALRPIGTVTLSTQKNQVAVAPGHLNKTWQENNRNYYEYKVNNPSPFNWHFASAAYAKNSKKHQNLEMHILHHPPHHYNVDFYQKSVSATYDFISAQLGQYPYKEMRVLEIPFYQEPMYAFSNVIAISEREGWFADRGSLENKSYLTYVVASQMLAHWIYERVVIANVQGADMLRYALPQCLSLQVVEEQHGEEAVQLLITKKQGLYFRDRGNEPNQEPPLLYADGIDYLEPNKGALALYDLSQKLGFNIFNKILRNWSHNRKKGYATFSELYHWIINTPEFQQLKEKEKETVKSNFTKVE
ncbi:MAG: hypothetical protein AAGH81_02255 [Bacteroidota bacterium]